MARERTVSSSDPGWTRRRAGEGFVYLDQLGKRMKRDQAKHDRVLTVAARLPLARAVLGLLQVPAATTRQAAVG